MQILVYKWKAYNYRDICEGFRSMGHEIDLLERKLSCYDADLIFEAELEECLRKKVYDFVFSVNYFGTIARVCEKMQIRYVSWACDSPLISLYHKSVFSPYNLIFTFDQSNYLEMKAMGVEHIWYLPLCVDTNRLDYFKQQSGVCYENEIAFVGSLYEKNSYDSYEKYMSEYLRGYLEAVVQAQLSVSGGNIIEDMLTPDIMEKVESVFALEKQKDSLSDLKLIFSTTVMGFKVAAVQRRNVLLALGKRFPVTLYSNSSGEDLLNVNTHGSVDYWTEMPLVFANSKINLNMTIPNIKSGIPLRVWDVLGCGGFLLTNYQAELPKYFEIGKDLDIFESDEELVEKCRFYLQHEEKRKRIAQNGYEKVKKYHTVENRLLEILAHLKEA